MNLEHVVDAIKKYAGRDVALSPMYSKIGEWRDWLHGNVKDFYEYSMTVDVVERKTARMKRHRTDMFKRACEDWASLLLNELTKFELDDDVSEAWLQGEDGYGGILGENDFRRNANELVVQSRWSGTAAFEVYIENMTIHAETLSLLSGDDIGINFLSADQIVPISHRNGIIKEVAFVSEKIEDGDRFQTVTMHLLENNLYSVTSMVLDDEGKPKGEPVTVRTGSDIPWFAIIRKSGYNRHDPNGPFGVSILDGNEDVLKGLDTAFDNFITDFVLGRKMVLMNSTMFNRDSEGNFVAPQMMGTQLFINVGDKIGDGKTFLEEYNPQLRVEENADGVQRMLDIFSFKTGLGKGFYKLDEDGMVKTATEYTGSKQALVRNVSKEMIGVESGLKQLIQAVLWVGSNVLHIPGIKPDAEVKVLADDSYIVDEYTERKVWQEEVALGLRSKQEYRERFMAESEEEAIEAIEKIKKETPGLGDLLGDTE